MRQKEFKELMGYDNRGILFDANTYILRKIYIEYRSEIIKLFSDYKKYNLSNYGIVETDFEEKLLNLKHKKHIISYPYEWTANMIKDAILFHLNLFIELDRFELTLKDSHLHNIVFDFSAPIFVDFLSIIDKDKLKCEKWLIEKTNYSDFRFVVIERLFTPFCLIPLIALTNKDYAKCRNLLSEKACNCNEKQPSWDDVNTGYIYFLFRKLLKNLSIISGNSFFNIKDLLKRIGLLEALKSKLKSPSNIRVFTSNPQSEKIYEFLKKEKKEDFVNFCKGLIAILKNIDVTPPSSGDLLNYYIKKKEDFDINDQLKWKDKQRNVFHLLKKLHPKRVLDLGANTGWYSTLAEHNGAEVIAIDIDEASIDKLYVNTKEQKLKILPLKMSFQDLTREIYGLTYDKPTYKDRDFKRNPIFLKATERFQSDLVICLALIHHLILGLGLEIKFIFKILSDLTLKYLILEYISLDDELIITNTSFFKNFSYTKDRYNIETIISNGSKYFKGINICDSHPHTRKLLVFEK